MIDSPIEKIRVTPHGQAGASRRRSAAKAIVWRGISQGGAFQSARYSGLLRNRNCMQDQSANNIQTNEERRLSDGNELKLLYHHRTTQTVSAPPSCAAVAPCAHLGFQADWWLIDLSRERASEPCCKVGKQKQFMGSAPKCSSQSDELLNIN